MDSKYTSLPSLLDLTIEEAARGLDSGRFTTLDLTKPYLARIDEASQFRAVLEVNPDALAVARELGNERARSGSRGPLHGFPILVKDNIATKDNLHASAGSYALLGAKPADESFIISKLREAGVLILGKTNLSEWANFRGLQISSGWGPRGGQTLDAYYPNSAAEDIIEFTKTFPAEEYPEHDIGKFLWTLAEDIDVNSKKYKEMVKQEHFYGGEGGILGAMDKHKLDLLMVPSSFGIASDLAAKIGFPVMGVPLGVFPEDTPIELDDNKPNLVRVAPGIPYSLTLISKAHSDGTLLKVAYAFEQLSKVRENGSLPFHPPTTELKIF